MDNYSQDELKIKGFWLYFRVAGDGGEIADYKLPCPQYYDRSNLDAYCVAWLIDGFFGTKRGRDFLNDIIARLSLVLSITKRLPFPPPAESAHTCSLRDFGNLPSLRNQQYREPNTAKYDDHLFWALKLEAIRRIRSDGWLSYEGFESWAFDVFINQAKDRSTLRAKCRNIWNWYDARGWRIDERSSTMSRAEAGKSSAEKNAKKTEAKVRGAISALEFMHEKITVTSVAKYAGVSFNTAKKYLQK